jgi:WD40 repeat protein
VANLVRRGEEAVHADEWGDVLELCRRVREWPGNEMNAGIRRLVSLAGRRSTRKGLRLGWCRKTLEDSTGQPTCAFLMSDGGFALTGNSGGALCLWDLVAGSLLHSLRGHTAPVRCVALSPDGRYALSGGGDNTLRIWDVTLGRCLRILQGHTEAVRSVTLSADALWAISGSRDRTLRLWEVNTGRCVRIFHGHTDDVNCVSLSADGRLLLSGQGKSLRLWELSTGRQLMKLVPSGYVCSVSNGRYALCNTSKGLTLWDVPAGRCLRTCEESDNVAMVRETCLSVDGRYALSVSGRVIQLWDAMTGRCVRTLDGHTNHVTGVCLSSDNRFVLSVGMDQTVRLWELDWEYEFPGWADWDDGARPYLEDFLTAHTPYAATLPPSWQTSGEEIELALTRRGRVTWADADFQRLLTNLENCGYGWLRPEGIRKKLKEMTEERDQVDSQMVGFETSARAAASRGDYRQVLTICRQASRLPGWAQHREGEELASIVVRHSRRKALRHATHTRTFEWVPGTNYLSSMCMSSDGRWAMSGGQDTRLWDVSNCSLARVFRGHASVSSSVLLSHDACWAISGSADKTLRLWDVSTGRCMRSLEGTPKCTAWALARMGAGCSPETTTSTIPLDSGIFRRAVSEISGGTRTL